MKSIQKKLLALVMLFLFSLSIHAQSASITDTKPEHKIIFQLTSSDTTTHKQLMKQFNNILSVSPSTKIEVVCQGGGLELLMVNKTIVGEKIKTLTEKGVHFVACEFAMKERKIEKSQMLRYADYVPAGVIEIVSKQEQGWSYIKSGN